MMELMKMWIALLAVALGARAAEMAEVKTVYVLPMSSSLDQFVAMHLTTDHVQVVTDPKRADAILCDRLGATLDDKLDELYGKTAPAPVKKLDSDAAKKGLSDDDKPAAQPVAHARGTVFLIDRRTRNVLWSFYERPKGFSPDDLNKAADRIAKELSKDLKTEPKAK
jgi:hypothetical protein